MKQLLYPLLFLPCLALAQYPGNANQKITLGEQTTADGLVYRGLAADTTRKPSVDTMAYILLDTATNIMWQYKKATSNAWLRVGGSISSGLTGTLPVANGGTGSATQNFVDLTTTQSSIGGTKTFTNQLIINTTASTLFTMLTTASAAFFGMQDNSGNNIFFGSDEGDFIVQTPNNSYQTKFIVKNNGNVGIGTASPLALLNVMGTVRINSASAPDANYYLQLENSSSQKAKANAWDTYSDKRIKTDIQPIFNAIDKVNLLNPVYYQKHDSYVENDFLNIDYHNSVKSLGFIAQEVYNVVPEAVNTGTTNELWAMDYTKIIPILTKAIQEQQALIKALEQRILNLENK